MYESWQHDHAGADVDLMSGTQFENCLAAMFVRLGYEVSLTETYDYGADLIVVKDGIRTAVQAKRRDGAVGERAVRDVHAARSSYHCHNAHVITNGEILPRARKQAEQCGVSLLDRSQLMRLLQMAGLIETPRLLPPPLCRRCQIPLVERHSRHGPFWGCANYPRGCHGKAQFHWSLVISAPASRAPQVPAPPPAPPPALAPVLAAPRRTGLLARFRAG